MPTVVESANKGTVQMSRYEYNVQNYDAVMRGTHGSISQLQESQHSYQQKVSPTYDEGEEYEEEEAEETEDDESYEDDTEEHQAPSIHSIIAEFRQSQTSVTTPQSSARQASYTNQYTTPQQSQSLSSAYQARATNNQAPLRQSIEKIKPLEMNFKGIEPIEVKQPSLPSNYNTMYRSSKPIPETRDTSVEPQHSKIAETSSESLLLQKANSEVNILRKQLEEERRRSEAELQRHKAAWEKERESLRKEVGHWQNEANEAVNDQEVINSALGELEIQKKDLEGECEQLQREASKWKEKYAQQRGELERLERENRKLQQSERYGESEENYRLQEENEKLVSDLRMKNEELKRQAALLESFSSEKGKRDQGSELLHNQIYDLQARHSDLEGDLRTEKERSEKQKENTRQLGQQNEKLQKELTTSNKQIDNLREEVLQSKAQVHDLKEELQQMKHTLQAMKNQTESLQRENDTLRRTTRDSDGRIGTDRKGRADLTAETTNFTPEDISVAKKMLREYTNKQPESIQVENQPLPVQSSVDSPHQRRAPSATHRSSIFPTDNNEMNFNRKRQTPMDSASVASPSASVARHPSTSRVPLSMDKPGISDSSAYDTKLMELNIEKRDIEAKLNRLQPNKATTRTNQVRQERLDLEKRLDQANQEINTIKIKLRFLQK